MLELTMFRPHRSRWARLILAALLLAAAVPLPAASPWAPSVALAKDDDDRDRDDRGGDRDRDRSDADDRSDGHDDDRSGSGSGSSDRSSDSSGRGGGDDRTDGQSNDRSRESGDDRSDTPDGDARGSDDADRSERARIDVAEPDEDAARRSGRRGAAAVQADRAPGRLEPIARGGGDVVSGEILAIGLPLAVRETLWLEGYRPIEEQALAALELRVTRLALPRGRGVGEVLRELARRFPQTRFSPNMVYLISSAETLSCTQHRCAGAELVGRRRVGASCPGGVRIGMLDTSVDRDAAPLRGSVIHSRRLAMGEPVASDHGTSIATLLVGRMPGQFSGLAPAAELLAGDVFWRDGEGRARSDALTLARGLDWLLERRADVVNLSLAGPPNVLLETAVKVLERRGIPVVAAVGNGGPNSRVGYPAAYPGVIAVTAVDRRLQVYAGASRGAAVTLAAPGVDLWLPLDGGRIESGTSIAAAVVTGAVAELRARLDPGDLLATLRVGARDLGAPGHDPVFGWGLVSLPQACG
jgi:hypothetical protein